MNYKRLSSNDLRGTLANIDKLAESGTVIRYGGGYGEDIWYDEEFIIGDDVRNHMNYKACYDELESRADYYHVTKGGDTIPITILSDNHLTNIIKYIERYAKSGLSVNTGLGYVYNHVVEEYDTLYGDDLKRHMNYGAYVNELESR